MADLSPIGKNTTDVVAREVQPGGFDQLFSADAAHPSPAVRRTSTDRTGPPPSLPIDLENQSALPHGKLERVAIGMAWGFGIGMAGIIPAGIATIVAVQKIIKNAAQEQGCISIPHGDSTTYTCNTPLHVDGLNPSAFESVAAVCCVIGPPVIGTLTGAVVGGACSLLSHLSVAAGEAPEADAIVGERVQDLPMCDADVSPVGQTDHKKESVTSSMPGAWAEGRLSYESPLAYSQTMPTVAVPAPVLLGNQRSSLLHHNTVLRDLALLPTVPRHDPAGRGRSRTADDPDRGREAVMEHA